MRVHPSTADHITSLQQRTLPLKQLDQSRHVPAQNGTPPRKPILYYSNYCENCRAVIGTLLKYDIRPMFACVCVDTKRNLVPPFVTTVPTVFLVNERVLLQGQDISSYLSKFVADKEKLFDSVLPVEGNSAMAEAYSWVDHEKAQQEENHFGSRFVPVDYTQHFDQIEENTVNSRASEKDLEEAFNKMRADFSRHIPNPRE